MEACRQGNSPTETVPLPQQSTPSHSTRGARFIFSSAPPPPLPPRGSTNSYLRQTEPGLSPIHGIPRHNIYSPRFPPAHSFATLTSSPLGRINSIKLVCNLLDYLAPAAIFAGQSSPMTCTPLTLVSRAPSAALTKWILWG